MNPTGQNGKVLTCIACGSYRHLLNERPDSWENICKTNCIETDDGLSSLSVLYYSLVIMKITYHY